MNHIPEKYDFPPGAKELPLQTVAWVTNVCNYVCGHCPFTRMPELRTQSPKYMDPYIFNLLTEDLKGRVVRLTGRGEPLMHPEFDKLCRVGMKNEARLCLVTNGSRLNGDTARMLLDAMAVVEVSIDAADAETYKKIRGGSFETVQANILHLVELRDRIGAATKVVVSIIEQRDLLPDFEAAVAYWKPLVDQVIERRWLSFNFMETEKYGVPFVDPEKRTPCPWLWDRLHFNTDGMAVVCADDLHMQHRVGSILDYSMTKLWRHPKMEQWRAAHIRGEYDNLPVCGQCTDWPYKSWTFNYESKVVPQ